LKILITSGIFPPDIGGPASYVPEISKALTGKGHIIDVVCLSDGVQYDDHDNYNFRVHRINRTCLKPWRILKTIYKIYTIAKSKDIVFANTLPLESSIGAFLARKPIIHKIVGDYAWENARNKGWYTNTIDDYQAHHKNLKLKALDIYFKFGFKFANALIVPSEYLNRMVKGWNENQNVQTIYNSIKRPVVIADSNEFQKEYIHLVTVCRLVAWKHVDEIIRELKRFENIKLHVVGDGPLKNDLQKLTIELGVSHRVVFYGQVHHLSTLKIMQKSDIFILNSSYEGLPHVVLEAMACGVLVVCNNVGGCGEVIKHLETGYLMERGSKERDIKHALEYFINNKFQVEVFKHNAIKIIEAKFGFENMVNETEKLFHLILKRKVRH
jgi:glycosyltransferase involved in cell wall biosynthesis